MEHLPPKRPSLIQRLFRRSPPVNAYREVHNLVARTDDPSEVLSESVDAIERSSAVVVRRRFRKQLRETLRQAVGREVRASRGEVPIRVEGLNTLAGALGFESSDVTEIRTAVARQYLAGLYSGLVIDPDFSFQNELPQACAVEVLGVDTDHATTLYEKAAHSRVQSRMDELLRDGYYSPDDEHAIQAEADRLGVPITFPGQNQRKLDEMRLVWQIEKGTPPTVEPGIHLQKNEVCYAIRRVEWYEHRSVTRRIRYAGPTARIRIAKGLYFRMGDLGVQRVSEDVTKLIDRGTVYLTSKRLLFVGGKKNSTIRISRVIDFTPYSNGVEIQKDSGKSPFIKFHQDVGLFAMLLERAVRDDRGRELPAHRVDPELDELIRHGSRVQAVKLVKDRTGLGLAEAKARVDQRASELGL